MSNSISNLLIRNLRDVFGENDPTRRHAVIAEIWAEDGVFYDLLSGAHRGRDEIDRVAGAIKATHPDFQYQPISEPEELGNAARVRSVSGRPGEAPAYAGTDFIIARDGRIPLSISFSTSCSELNSTVRISVRGTRELRYNSQEVQRCNWTITGDCRAGHVSPL